MNKNVKRAPMKDTISSFNDIKKFIKGRESNDEKRMSLQLRETHKMPYKRYHGIKLSVIKKHDQNVKHNISNSILAETHGKKKLMTKVIEKRLEAEDNQTKERKIRFSRAKTKTKFREGVMNLSKNFLKNVTGGANNNNFNKGANNKSSNIKGFNKSSLFKKTN